MSDYIDSVNAVLSPTPSGDWSTLYSTFNLSGTSVINSNLLGGVGAQDIDWSGIQVYPQVDYPEGKANAAAITPRIIIAADHGGPSVNEVVKFVDADGQAHTRTPIDYVLRIGPTFIQDFRLIYLDSDLPENVAKYPILADRGPDFRFGFPVFKFNQFRKVGVKDVVDETGDFEGVQDALVLETSENALRSLYNINVIGFDSGSSAFACVGGRLIYCTGLTQAGGSPFGTVAWGPSSSRWANLIYDQCVILDRRNANTGDVPELFRAETNVAPRVFLMSGVN